MNLNASSIRKRSRKLEQYIGEFEKHQIPCCRPKFYNPRWYDPYLNQFTQPDSIIPDPGNPADFNRYSYTRNNPVNFVDPSGHDPIEDDAWIEELVWLEKGGISGDLDVLIQDYLITLIIVGNGANGSWTSDDWDVYQENRDDLWSGEMEWSAHFNEASGSFDRFTTHIERLASHYDIHSETDAFVRAVGLMWGGIPYHGFTTVALGQAGFGGHHSQLYEGTAGWDPSLLDDNNPAHHWAGGFVAGYNFHKKGGIVFNTGREFVQWITGQGGSTEDVALGNIAASQGNQLWHDTTGFFQEDDPIRALITNMSDELGQ